ncbi:hypothetical protein BH23VER1_BH23VER1_13190 [soil metagenome]
MRARPAVLVAPAVCLLCLLTGCGDQDSGTVVAEVRPSGGIGEPEPEAVVPSARTPWDQLDSPVADGWDTEVFTEQANAQLGRLGKLLASGDGAAAVAAQGEDLVVSGFVSPPLGPPVLERVFEDATTTVERSGSTAEVGAESGGLAKGIAPLIEPFRDATDRRSKFKLFNVHPTDGGVETRQFLALSGRTPDGMVEVNATWKVEWRTSGDGSPPRIGRIEVEDFERVTTRMPSGPLFSDITTAVFGDDRSYQTQILRGYDHWLDRIHHGIYLELLGTPGIAVGDVNGDGLDDIYLCQERGLPNRLFLQNADGTVTDVAAEWGVDWLEASRGALLVDLDNDGDQDLVVAVAGGVVLASNEDGQGFRFRGLVATTEDTMSLSAVDFDQDGDLDIYVCAYFADKSIDEVGGSPDSTMAVGDAGFVLHDANNGGANALLRNDISEQADGAWAFVDVTVETGLDLNNRRFSFGASWEDYDNDGDQDLYVANDFGRDNLYRNDVAETGGFTDVSEAANVEDAGTGMGIAWGDFNRDGWMDAYVSNMFSAAGNRVTFQPQFKPGAPDEVKDRLRRLARGNTLLQNAGDGTFADVSAPAGVTMGRWAWTAQFLDFNNDGWEDLFVANGYITTPDTGDL